MFSIPLFTLETSKDHLGFLQAHFLGKKSIPERKVLVDSHFHLGRKLFQTEEDRQEIVHSFFNAKVGIQAISDYGLFHPIHHVVPYEEFVAVLPKIAGIEVVFSDTYASIVKRGDEQVIFTKGIEVETILEGSTPSVFRENHQIHIAAEGFDHLQASGTHALLEEGQRQGAYMTIAHPFTVPAGKTPIPVLKQLSAFLPPTLDEIKELYKIAKEFPVFLEGLNTGNTLWMTFTNAGVRVFAQKHDFPLIYNTDAHTRPSPPFLTRHGVSKYWLFKEQVGSAGTLLEEETVQNLKSLTGKEILEKKYEAIHNHGERYGEVSNTWIFGFSVAATHLEFLLP
ncbi:MAG TPA: hypothetical protein HA360_03775 [Nanoarchaeota archaeon]|nr:hypothetical protein [Candidatus Woesearchaeota archaeon]HIH14657.1 hypothetical protein [Nanoarchaeota archaeon]HIH59155.1 hypothetical protein [Nanoarchaeota archaeon]HII14167.1 hypothetical protein [Nanoarchaeota archaeon]HIJ05618.1 hypothetical protein [Nanoarchaeota archaeon]